MALHDEFYVEPADWRFDRGALAPVRLEVFVAEQGVPEDEEFDDDDPRSRHFVARDLQGQVIGTARLTPDGRIGRMAVLRDWRGHGVGTALLQAALEAARLRGDPEVRLSSQVHALPFYAAFGFEPEGETFDECGIPHRWMRRPLDPLHVAPVDRRRWSPEDPAGLPGGRFSGPAEYAERVRALLACTRQRLDVFTWDLEPPLLNRPDIVEGLRRLLAFAREPRVRVLVVDSARAVELGHRWIKLAQERPSALGIRNPPAEFAEEGPAYLIADGAHVICREVPERWDGFLRVGDHGQARQLGAQFETAWEHGHPDPNARRLSI